MLEITMPNPDENEPMEFEFLTGDVDWETYGGSWISKESFHNGDFQYWLVINFINMDDACGDPLLLIEINAVSPDEAAAELESALQSYGMPDDFLQSEYGQSDAFKVEVLHSYGIYVTLWRREEALTEEQQDNADYYDLAEEMFEYAKRVAPATTSLFGFAMDGPVNGIGSTGWDAIRGDLLAGLRRYQESQD